MGLEITVVDHSQVSGWLRSVFSFGAVDMRDVKSMVRNVIFATKLEEKIDRLNIVDHGDEDGMQIGSDYVSDLNLTKFTEELRRLRSFFSDDGFVHLQHCQIGENRVLLCALARIWDVSVYAGTGYDQGVYRFNTSYYVRADPDGTFETDVDRP
jgi:hypothetical protein